ncbi:MAG TPA: heme ABC transporter ATP-binding protein [Gammaproteobacteria bacterium]|nr:heme ABC transporter ATP-binding protein [Gammaproteobacteria bacterium]HIK68775.1 heme ABC transporter ATP-binding protein [Pseudomonadales bacterium]
MSLRLSQVSYRIGEKCLLRDVSFQIGPGKLLVVLGPNGAGKSTLLHLAAGDYQPAEGEIRQFGHDPFNLPRSQRATRIGVLPQSSRLDFPFKVREVVHFGRSPFVTSQEENKRVVAEVLLAMALDRIAERDYLTLSGGEKQRVQIARVLAQIWSISQGTCLFLDEPLTSLDLAHQLMLMRLLKTLATGGHCICVVLHDLNLAMRYGDLIALLNGSGELAEFGEPPAVLTPQAIQAIFGVKTTLQPSQFNDRPGLLFE